MQKLSLATRRKAKELLEVGHTSEEIAQILNIRAGTVREWKRRYEWDCPLDEDWRLTDETQEGEVPEEYIGLMGQDVLESLKRIRNLPMSFMRSGTGLIHTCSKQPA